jgi:ADP-ribosylglycohydrolase
MAYPGVPDFRKLGEQFALCSQLKHEHRAKGIGPVLQRAERAMRAALRDLRRLPVDRALARREPSDLDAIRALRPRGPRRLIGELDVPAYTERLEGALLGRFAGCTLGAPVEGWPIRHMHDLAKEYGDDFPPTDYWRHATTPYGLRYGLSRRDAYTRDKMDGVPVDDDVTYTLLGLLIVEDYGPDFTVEEVGNAWLKYLPMACTAEHIALENLKKGVPAARAGQKDNPFCEWIGADIRSDPWGYLAPGCPEIAAGMAWRDAYLSHRRQGIYGEMFFAAAISAALVLEDAVQALRIGLTEIPRDCALAKVVRWALREAPHIKGYRQARDAVDRRFAGMSSVHTINNACLTIWGLTIGGRDFTRVIGETVAMGLDNDCTAATAGSIAGAVLGKKGIPAHWYAPFNNTVYTYMNRRKKFRIDSVVKRFVRQARKIVG